MRRFIKEYSYYQLANNPFCCDDVRNQIYIYRINKAVKMCENGYITINDCMKMILDAEQYARQEGEA